MFNFFDFDFKECREKDLGYYFSHFEEIEGWGVDELLIRVICQLDYFQKKWAIKGSMIEIGVHHGRTFVLLDLLKRNEEFSLAIDLFENMQELNLDQSMCNIFEKVSDEFI